MLASKGSTALLTPETLLKDRWEPLRKIGGGGFGEIYKAKDRESKKVNLLEWPMHLME